MSLQDLVINNKQISTELLEGLLKDRVELIQEDKKVNLTKKGIQLPNRGKILLFLTGGKAWEFLDGAAWTTSPNDMQEYVGIPGNTLRPILKELTDNFLVKNENGKYQILPKGIYELETMLEKKTAENGAEDGKSKSPTNRKSSGGPSKAGAIGELFAENFFAEPRELGEIQGELGRRGLSVKLTSLPAYVLPLVRKKILTREHKLKGKGKVWTYKNYK